MTAMLRRPRRGRPRVASVALAVAMLGILTGCDDGGERVVVGAQSTPTPSIYALPPEPDAKVAVAQSEEEDAPAAAVQRTADGVALPDPDTTSGAAFADVANKDICQFHYTKSVRQPRYNDKVMAFATYGVSIHERDVYHVDHLIPISLGGSNEVKNLWPQPYDGARGADQKNLLERQLRGLVCSGTLTLGEAQSAIATDWWAAYGRYMRLPIKPGSAGPELWQRPSEDAGEVRNGGPCTKAGAVGYTVSKPIKLTCRENGLGELRWAKRY